jgi:hypothetical protein
VASVLLGAAVPTVAAQSPAKVKVLITFAEPPGFLQQTLLRSVGAEIRYTYRSLPVIAASVPEVALTGLRHNPRVTAVEHDLELRVVDAELDSAWGVKRIGAGNAHAAGNVGAGVKVGILDTGIDVDHPDLVYDPSCSASFVSGESLDDGHSHGTHVAGTIAGLDNGTGVVGVAPGATLCIYKVMSNSGAGNYSDVIAALERAVADGVQVTNNSYGSTGDPGLAVKAAFGNAYAAGMLHVAAAGNYGNAYGIGDNCIYPARWDTVMATAATTSSDARASFSSTCAEVEIAAPGSLINSTLPGGAYGPKSGTSMASPHVAGAAALFLAAAPGASNAQIRAQLQSTADDLGDPGRDVQYGYGLVDVDEGTLPDPPPPDPTPEPTPEPTPLPENLPPEASFAHDCPGLACTFDASDSTDVDGYIADYTWEFGDGGASSSAADPVVDHTYGAPGSYTVKLTVQDDDGADDAAWVTVNVSDGSPSLTANGYKVKGVHHVDLGWTGFSSDAVDIYREADSNKGGSTVLDFLRFVSFLAGRTTKVDAHPLGELLEVTPNDGEYLDVTGNKGWGHYTYQVCESGTSICSPKVVVDF